MQLSRDTKRGAANAKGRSESSGTDRPTPEGSTRHVRPTAALNGPGGTNSLRIGARRPARLKVRRDASKTAVAPVAGLL